MTEEKMTWEEMIIEYRIMNQGNLILKDVIFITKVVERAKEQEKEKIENRLENYMKGTCLEQDSIFLRLHDLVFGGEKQ